MNEINETVGATEQPHRPSRRQGIFFLLFTLALAGGVVAWVFVLNKGTLTVNGPAPFIIEVLGENTTCNRSPCTLRLSPRTYTVKLKKDGFFDELRVATVRRSTETTLTAEFAFIPTVKEVGEVVLPVPNAPLKKPFVGLRRFENFPRDARATVFSPSEKQVLVDLGREVYAYDVDTKTVEETPLKAMSPHGFLGEKIVFLEKTDGGESLRVQNGDTSEEIVRFARPFTKAQFVGSSAGTKLVIMDESAGVRMFYLVDSETKSRKRLELRETAANARITGGSLVFENAGDVFAFGLTSFETRTLPAASAATVIETGPGVFLFVSGRKLDGPLAQLGPTIGEALAIAEEEAAVGTAGESWFVIEFDAAQNTSRVLTSISRKSAADGKDEPIERLGRDDDGKKIYFEKAGKLFEVALF